jgi:hypothetical protein
MQRFFDFLDRLRRLAQALGPYLLLEILLPGGTLFALLFFLYRSGKLSLGSVIPQPAFAVARALVAVGGHFGWRNRPRFVEFAPARSTIA